MTASLIAPGALVLLAAVLAVSFALLPLGLRRQRDRRRRAVPTGVFGGLDEVFHPEAHESRLVWDARLEASEPMPAPGEPPFPGGRITVVVPTRTSSAPSPGLPSRLEQGNPL